MPRLLGSPNRVSGSSVDLDSDLILDSTAFYAGTPFSSSRKFYTTKAVLEEVMRGEEIAMRVEMLKEVGRLVIIEPSKGSYEEVSSVSRRMEGTKMISNADVSILAICLDLSLEGRGAAIVSDDYAVQNVAKVMNLQYRPVLFRGIRDAGRWRVFCPGCGKRYQDKVPKICDSCGTELRRRLRRTQS